MTTTTPAETGALAQIRHSGFMAIVRGVREELLAPTLRTLASAGVGAVEVTLDTPGALTAVAALAGSLPAGVELGVGTVRTRADARAAVEAGARFLVCPNTDPAVITFARESGIEVFPGALTPTEILTAWQLGATAVKVFPVSLLGGTEYLRALRGPLAGVPLIAVGGVGLDEVRSFEDAGAVGVALGSSLVNANVIDRDGPDGLPSLVRAVQAARQRSADDESRAQLRR